MTLRFRLSLLAAWLTDHNLFPPCSAHLWDNEYDDVLICLRPRWHKGEHECGHYHARWDRLDNVWRPQV